MDILIRYDGAFRGIFEHIIFPMAYETVDQCECILALLKLGEHCLKFTDEVFVDAVQSGDIEVVQWLGTQFPEIVSKDAIALAVVADRVEILMWLLEHGFRHEVIGVDPVGLAAICGDLPMIEWLLGAGFASTPWAIDNAAAKGHLEVVKKLHVGGPCCAARIYTHGRSCIASALALAAGNGHLDIVQWLCDGLSEHCTIDAMIAALEGNHAHVVQYLFEKCGRWDVFEAMRRRIYNNAMWHLKKLYAARYG